MVLDPFFASKPPCYSSMNREVTNSNWLIGAWNRFNTGACKGNGMMSLYCNRWLRSLKGFFFSPPHCMKFIILWGISGLMTTISSCHSFRAVIFDDVEDSGVYIVLFFVCVWLVFNITIWRMWRCAFWICLIYAALIVSWRFHVKENLSQTCLKSLCGISVTYCIVVEENKTFW